MKVLLQPHFAELVVADIKNWKVHIRTVHPNTSAVSRPANSLGMSRTLMPVNKFTLTEASRSSKDLQAVLQEHGLVILTQRGKPSLAAVDLNLFLRMLRVVNQVSKIVNELGLARLIEVTGLLSESVQALDDSVLKNPAWPAQTLSALEAVLGAGSRADEA
jgi:hypothetical protein